MEPVLCCFMLCERVERQGGKFNLVGVFYRVHVRQFPTVCHCNVIVGWFGGEGYYDFGLRLLPPGGGKSLMELPLQTFTLTGERPYYNAVINATLPLPRDGIYRFEIDRAGRALASFPLFVLPAGPVGLSN